MTANGRESRVFCNRSLRLDQVELIGFDMDYTIAAYHQDAMDRASIDATVRRLVETGYPQTLVDFDYPVDFPIRGLLVDITRGNILKMDRYRYVKKAYHGLTPVSRDERRQLYEHRPSPGSSQFRWVDTLYSLADVTVYASAIACLEGSGAEVNARQLWDDVRACADAAHGSGEIYRLIAADFDRFVLRDDRLAPALHRLRSAGKKLFLLTNSQPETTEMLMEKLLDGTRPEYPTWRHYFDVIIADSRKPQFFTEDRPFVEVARPAAAVTQLRRDRIYRGGNREAFERLMGVSGPAVLYVGDHIYGDVLRANVESGWRTVMIIQEMADELAGLAARGEDLDRIDALDAGVDELTDQLRVLRATAAAQNRRPDRQADRLVEQIRALQTERDALEADVDQAFHPYWGSLFKAGTELSSFGAQIEQYAWLYTARVSNLGGYSPGHYFRSPRALMAHDQ